MAVSRARAVGASYIPIGALGYAAVPRSSASPRIAALRTQDTRAISTTQASAPSSKTSVSYAKGVSSVKSPAPATARGQGDLPAIYSPAYNAPVVQTNLDGTVVQLSGLPSFFRSRGRKFTPLRFSVRRRPNANTITAAGTVSQRQFPSPGASAIGSIQGLVTSGGAVPPGILRKKKKKREEYG